MIFNRKKQRGRFHGSGRGAFFLPLLLIVYLLLAGCGSSNLASSYGGGASEGGGEGAPQWEEVGEADDTVDADTSSADPESRAADPESRAAVPELVEGPADETAAPVYTAGIADFPADTSSNRGDTSVILSEAKDLSGEAGTFSTAAFAEGTAMDDNASQTGASTSSATSAVVPEPVEGTASDTAAESTSTEPALPNGQTSASTETTAASEQTTAASSPVEGPANTTTSRTIVIDPGHQSKANTGTEPLGPGSSEMKTKVSGGTRGVATGVPEYQLVLTIGLALKAELQARGYTVVMTRESNDVNISNAERAAVANNIGAAALVRLHADGSENASTRGCMTICQTASNPYNASLHNASYALSSAILNAYSSATGAKANRIWETDTMTGINWAQVPCTILEMGYMTNAEEDRLMQDASYQAKMVQGIANGIDAFINR